MLIEWCSNVRGGVQHVRIDRRPRYLCGRPAVRPRLGGYDYPPCQRCEAVLMGVPK